MKKILFIAPHLSTGGSPQYLYKQIEQLREVFDIWCVEWSDVTGGVLVVQRNRIKNILKNELITLGENKNDFLRIIKKIKPDVIHLQEVPEMFMEFEVAKQVYSKNRDYVIIETSHDSSFDINTKIFLPDKFLMVSDFQVEMYKPLGIPCELAEYPIEKEVRTLTREQILGKLGLDPNLKHVINVGLFTPRKNQGEVIEYGRKLIDQPIQFHFIGNHAENFEYYWKPLMAHFPSNCKWWNERDDVDLFYQLADMMLFTSRGGENDKETMPLVLKEAISWETPTLCYNLPVYLNYFDKHPSVKYLDFDDLDENVNIILTELGLKFNPKLLIEDFLKIQRDVPQRTVSQFLTLEGEMDFKELDFPGNMMDTMLKYGDSAAMYWGTFIYKELDKGGIEVEKGDVFVDLGANIGISSRYALSKGAKEVHCFEPDPKMCEILKENLPSANIQQLAIDSIEKVVELYHWPYNPVNIGPKYTARVVTLKRILSLFKDTIDYLKMDIEGFEEHLFDDITYEEASKIKKLFVEHHNPPTTDSFIKKLEQRGFVISFYELGKGQNYIYATHEKYKPIKEEEYGFKSRWSEEDQRGYFSTKIDINTPLYVAIKEYKSDGVLWSSEFEGLKKDIEYWMSPVSKDIKDYSKDKTFSGVKICVYDKKTGKELFEQPHFVKYVNKPTITLSNYIPYFVNYEEFFTNKKYDRFFKQPHKNVVDVGANVGIFTRFLLENNLAENVICVECDKKALLDLNENFKLCSNVKVVPKALHSELTEISFYHSPENPVISSTLSPDKLANHMAGVKGNVEYKIETTTIKELIDELGVINLLKIDIEGGEYDIIENLDERLFGFIDEMFIECHFFEENYLFLYERLVSKLIKNGYHIEEYKENQVLAGSSEVIYVTKINKL